LALGTAGHRRDNVRLSADAGHALLIDIRMPLANASHYRDREIHRFKNFFVASDGV
jgi:hypothetical protein